MPTKSAGLSPEAFKSTVEHYRRLHDDSRASVDERKANYTTLVNQYYDLATDFYEYAWGKSFHFAPRVKGESFKASILRHEHFLSRKLGLKPGMEVLDVGCGVGGPMRNIARYSGARIVGLNNNAYQIERGEHHTRREKLGAQCSFLKADFMNIPTREERFDAIYTIEASCHAPDRVGLFTELNRVMKPGAVFGGFEWCLTDKYDGENAEHRRIKKEIEEGDGLPDIAHTSEIDAALLASGFELVEVCDLATCGSEERPWYYSLTGGDLTLASIPRTPIGRQITNVATAVLERLRILPEGTAEVSRFLGKAGDALVEGGEREIFTPMYYFLARKK
ncbi:MAG: methyltransferase domain-containing protein [Myxococcota bacterium]